MLWPPANNQKQPGAEIWHVAELGRADEAVAIAVEDLEGLDQLLAETEMASSNSPAQTSFGWTSSVSVSFILRAMRDKNLARAKTWAAGLLLTSCSCEMQCKVAGSSTASLSDAARWTQGPPNLGEVDGAVSIRIDLANCSSEVPLDVRETTVQPYTKSAVREILAF